MYAIGHDYDLGGARDDLIKIKTYEDLVSMLHTNDAHVNLFLSKEECVL
jgi:hypothetical protein